MATSDVNKYNPNNNLNTGRFANNPNENLNTGRFANNPNIVRALPAPVSNNPNIVRALPAPVSTPASTSINYLDLFKGQSYYNDPEFQNIVQQYQNRAGQFGVVPQNAQPTYQQLTGYIDTFKNQFQNYVGRDPKPEEYNQFFKFLGQQGPWAQEVTAFSGKIGPETTGLIKDYYTREAQNEAQKQLETQTQAAIAPNSAFDVWQNSYRNTLSDVEKSLSDYQTKLFEKLRPNLITSLQAQGLLNSGALNEAFAGAGKDLASEAANQIANARGAVEQDIANQRYQLASAPTSYQLSNTANNPANLINSGQQALQNVWQGVLQQNEFNNQRRLLEMAPKQTSNPLAQYGGLILGGIAGGLPGAFASYAGQRYAADKKAAGN